MKINGHNLGPNVITMKCKRIKGNGAKYTWEEM